MEHAKRRRVRQAGHGGGGGRGGSMQGGAGKTVKQCGEDQTTHQRDMCMYMVRKGNPPPYTPTLSPTHQTPSHPLHPPHLQPRFDDIQRMCESRCQAGRCCTRHTGKGRGSGCVSPAARLADAAPGTQVRGGAADVCECVCACVC